jgi:hypothetical protein
MDTDADTPATPRAGPDPELLATMHALATSIKMMQVGQKCTTHFLQVDVEQQQQNQHQLHERVS